MSNRWLIFETFTNLTRKKREYWLESCKDMSYGPYDMENIWLHKDLSGKGGKMGCRSRFFDFNISWKATSFRRQGFVISKQYSPYCIVQSELWTVQSYSEKLNQKFEFPIWLKIGLIPPCLNSNNLDFFWETLNYTV